MNATVDAPSRARHIDPGMDGAVVAEIDRRLDAIARDEGVALPLAIESGSRAWGFPSPDSDYDCRFLFVRSPARTFSILPPRDVIEREVTPVFDLGGWELRKALVLLLRGNAVVIEWLTSPVTYRADPPFRRELTDLARLVTRRDDVLRHYVRLARAMHHQHDLGAGTDVPLKKLFYALRPVFAARWLLDRPGETVAPMHFPTLLAQSDVAPPLRAAIEALLERKRQTREIGRGPVPGVIHDDLARAMATLPDVAHAPEIEADRLARADAFHGRWVERLAR